MRRGREFSCAVDEESGLSGLSRRRDNARLVACRVIYKREGCYPVPLSFHGIESKKKTVLSL